MNITETANLLSWQKSVLYCGGFWLSGTFKKAKEFRMTKVGWLIAGIFEKKGEANKNRKKAP